MGKQKQIEITRVSVAEARRTFSALTHGTEPIIIRSHWTSVAVIVPVNRHTGNPSMAATLRAAADLIEKDRTV